MKLDDVLKNMKDLKNKYKLKCVMLNCNHSSVGLQSIKPKDLMVSGSRSSNDKILNMLAKEEEGLSSLSDIKESYNLHRDMAINILVEYASAKSKEEMIEIYRDKMHFKWNDIAWLVGYSRSQTIEIYNKNNKSDTIGRFNVL